MSYRSVAKRRIAGFTLIEMLVTLALLGILATLSGAIVLRARAKGRAMRCRANQQQITNALLSFYADHSAFPPDGPSADLALSLKDYIPHSPSSPPPEVYRCPNDREGPAHNSYQSYYVKRKEPVSSDYFVLGCPRHKDAHKSYLNTLGLSGGSWGKEGCIVINDQPVDAESSEAERTICTGTMEFEDKSSVTIVASTGSYKLTATASFRQEDGRLYTIVRAEGEGLAVFEVTPGSRFELVTPVAIIGVRGTKFLVYSGDGFVRVGVGSGTVHVWDRLTGKTQLVHVTESADVGETTRGGRGHHYGWWNFWSAGCQDEDYSWCWPFLREWFLGERGGWPGSDGGHN